MEWKKQLKQLEDTKDFGKAIKLLQNVIIKDSNNMDAYIAMNYLLMNLLVEEFYDRGNLNYYADLLKKYFTESYAKFSENPEYLFFTEITAYMSEWYFDIDIEEAQAMFKKAIFLEPNNALYQWGYHSHIDMRNLEYTKQALPYAHLILTPNSSEKKTLQSKGAIGEYLLEILPSWTLDAEQKMQSKNLPYA